MAVVAYSSMIPCRSVSIAAWVWSATPSSATMFFMEPKGVKDNF